MQPLATTPFDWLLCFDFQFLADFRVATVATTRVDIAKAKSLIARHGSFADPHQLSVTPNPVETELQISFPKKQIQRNKEWLVLREGWYPGASSFFWIYPPTMHQQSSIILAPAAGAEVAIPAIQSEEMGFQTIALAQEETLRLRAMHRNMFCLNSSGCLCESGTIVSPMILASWSKVHANYCHQSFKNRVHPKFLVINKPISNTWLQSDQSPDAWAAAWRPRLSSKDRSLPQATKRFMLDGSGLDIATLEKNITYRITLTKCMI